LLELIKKTFNFKKYFFNKRILVLALGGAISVSIATINICSAYNTSILEQKANAVLAYEQALIVAQKANEPVVVTETVEVSVPFTQSYKANSNLEFGQERIAVNSENGTRVEIYEVVYKEGVMQEKNLVSTETVKQPVNQVVEVGNGGVTLASRGDETRYSQVLTMTATGYDPCILCCGKDNAITATGMKAAKGVVAVDPKVIPLGSKVYVETADGSYVYGTAIAADTGGAIKGMKIDLCFNSHQEALNFGRRTVKVYVE